MKRLWIVVYAGSVLMGVALWRLVPSRWGLEPTLSILFGSALYFGALHRYTLRATDAGGPIRWVGRRGMLAGLIARAAIFVAVAGIQAYACYEWLPGADVRGGFVVSTTWLASLSLIDPPAWVKEPRVRAG